MNDALHAAASAMSTRIRALDTSSQNMVNAVTPGYLPRILANNSFATALDQELGRDPSMVHVQQTLSFRQGRLINSDSPTAVALDGPGFLRIQAPSGIAYTRNGDLMAGRDGTLQTRAGYPVLGQNGTIVADPNKGPVEIGDGGAVLQDGQVIGQLEVFEFADNSRLTPIAETIFEADDAAGAAPSAGTRIAARTLEVPWDGPMTSMVAMIAANHQFESAQRVMSTINRSYQQLWGTGGN